MTNTVRCVFCGATCGDDASLSAHEEFEHGCPNCDCVCTGFGPEDALVDNQGYALRAQLHLQ